MPVTKTMGDDVFAGTLNEEGYIEIEVTKRSNETVLSKIVELVKESQNRKSSTETFIDKFAKYYTPAVILLAVYRCHSTRCSIWITIRYMGLQGTSTSYNIMSMCFLLSTPVAMVSGITASTKNGVLIKGLKVC